MKTFTNKSILLFAATMAACAFAIPAAGSAASWRVVGTEHGMDWSNIGFSSATGVVGSCANSSFTSNVANSTTLTITTGTFSGCTSSLPAAGADCLTTWRNTGFPWRATAVTTTDIQIHGMHVDITFEDMPGMPGSCGALKHFPTTLTGTLAGGHWTGNGANQHEVVWNNGTGLTTNTGSAVTLLGTFRDTQQTLVVTG